MIGPQADLWKSPRINGTDKKTHFRLFLLLLLLLLFFRSETCRLGGSTIPSLRPEHEPCWVLDWVRKTSQSIARPPSTRQRRPQFFRSGLPSVAGPCLYPLYVPLASVGLSPVPSVWPCLTSHTDHFRASSRNHTKHDPFWQFFSETIYSAYCLQS